MTLTELKEFLSLLQTFIVPILGYGLYRLNRIDDTLLELRDHVAKLNGRISTCEELREMHERNDKEKHEGFAQRLHDLEKTLIGTKRLE